MRPSARRIPFLLCLAVALAACGEPERPAPTPASAHPHVVLISIDTLRADHLGAYGYARGTTPELDAFAAGAIRYAEAWAPAPWTLPSHAALLTGRHPAEIGIRDFTSRIPEAVPMLAEHFALAGYRTAGFVDSTPDGLVGGERGFARGFHTYAHLPLDPLTKRLHDVSNSVDRALAFVDEGPTDAPFFLFLHTKSVHTLPVEESQALPSGAPYDAPEPFRSRFAQVGPDAPQWRDAEGNAGVRYLGKLNRGLAGGTIDAAEIPAERREALRHRYDVAVAYVDDQLGRLFRALDERGLFDPALIAVTSDHGEAFLEHRLLLHKELHREVLRVPLLLKLPTPCPAAARPDAGDCSAGGVVDTPVPLQDLAPALLLLAGLEPIAGTQTLGLPLPGRPDPADPRDLFAYAQRSKSQLYGGFALRRGRHALIQDRLGGERHHQLRLYDMQSDPGETHPIEGPARAELLRALDAWRSHRGIEGARKVDLDPETARHLRALGYLD